MMGKAHTTGEEELRVEGAGIVKVRNWDPEVGSGC